MKRHREAQGWGLRQAARNIGITHNWLLNVEQGQTSTDGRPFRPSREVIGKIARAYDLPERLLLVQAGYIDGEYLTLSQEEREVVTLFAALRPDHQRLALSMLRVFLADEKNSTDQA